ncbi:MAG: hypothetical protein HGA80_05685, partial [Candidatus Omnitrophica bacterium]|nr:hypothetical protein [Candidatus Omnitrophota bacterium]
MDILKKTVSFRAVSILVLASFVATSVMPPQAFAQALNLPAPGAMVGPSATFEPVLMKGLKVHPENPLLFD